MKFGMKGIDHDQRCCQAPTGTAISANSTFSRYGGLTLGRDIP